MRFDKSPLFFSVDLILTEDREVKILEFNRGVNSGFSGYESLTGVDLWETALGTLGQVYDIQPDNYYYDGVDEYTGRLPRWLNPIDELKGNGQGCLIYPGVGSNIGHLRRMYPHAVIVDDAPAMYGAMQNKAILDVLFRPLVPELFPKGLVVSLGEKAEVYDIVHEVAAGKSGVVVKTAEESQGLGVDVFRNNSGGLKGALSELRSKFKYATDAEFGVGALTISVDDVLNYDVNDHVKVLQSLEDSQPVEFEGESYRSCIRLALLVMPMQDVYGCAVIGGYHKPALSPIGSSKQSEYKSVVSAGDNVRTVKLDDKDLSDIMAQLGAHGFVEAIGKVAKMRQSDMMQALLKPYNKLGVGAALFPLFSREYIDEAGFTRAQVRKMTQIFEKTLDDNPRFEHQVLLRYLSGGDVAMPEVFKGVVQRRFYNAFTIRNTVEDAMCQTRFTISHKNLTHAELKRDFEHRVRVQTRDRALNDGVAGKLAETFLMLNHYKTSSREYVLRGNDNSIFNVSAFTSPLRCMVDGCVKRSDAKLLV